MASAPASRIARLRLAQRLRRDVGGEFAIRQADAQGDALHEQQHAGSFDLGGANYQPPGGGRHARP
jgi:hypothetical protein